MDVSSSGYVASLSRAMNWKGYGRSELWPNARQSLEVFLKGLMEITLVILEYHSGRLYLHKLSRAHFIGCTLRWYYFLLF